MNLPRSRVSSRGFHKRGDDSFLLVTLAQGILCATMLVAAYIISNIWGMTQYKQAFAVLLNEETDAQEVASVFSKAVNDERSEWFRNVVRGLLESIFGKEPDDAAETSQAQPEAGTQAGLDAAGQAGFDAAVAPSLPLTALARPVFFSAPPLSPVCGTLSSSFGQRENPVVKQEDFHTGIDLACPQGTPIFAAWPGTVKEVGVSEIYGNYVVLEHSKVCTRYCHCEQVLVREQMRIRQGEQIATVGCTGWATGPHLHFEILLDGQAINPQLVESSWGDM